MRSVRAPLQPLAERAIWLAGRDRGRALREFGCRGRPERRGSRQEWQDTRSGVAGTISRRGLSPCGALASRGYPPLRRLPRSSHAVAPRIASRPTAAEKRPTSPHFSPRVTRRSRLSQAYAGCSSSGSSEHGPDREPTPLRPQRLARFARLRRRRRRCRRAVGSRWPGRQEPPAAPPPAPARGASSKPGSRFSPLASSARPSLARTQLQHLQLLKTLIMSTHPNKALDTTFGELTQLGTRDGRMMASREADRR